MIEQAIEHARSYVGVKFRHTGRSRNGIDCVGLVRRYVIFLGYLVPDRRNYGRNPAKDGLRNELLTYLGNPVPDRRLGDIALMRWYRDDTGDLFTHVGIVATTPYGSPSLIHALAQNKRVIEHRIDAPWERRIVEVFRPIWSAA